MRLTLIDFLAIGCYACAFASPYLGPLTPLSYTIVTMLLVFAFPGWYLVKLLTGKGILGAPTDLGLGLVLIPSLSVSYTVLIGALSIITGSPISVFGLSFGTIALQALSILANSGPILSLPRFSRVSTVSFSVIIALPVLRFVAVPLIMYPPSPFPLATGWDVFTYLMIAGRVQSGFLASPLTTVNPITRQLPIPTGLPILGAFLMPPGIIHPESVVALIKYGAIIPSLLSLAWIFLICRLITKNSYLALLAGIVAYSFAGYNVIDTTYFLPASFAWTYSLMAAYFALVSSRIDRKLILLSIAAVTAISFHFYSGAAATAITALGMFGANIPRLNLPKIANRLAELYPVWGSGAVLGVNLLGFSFNIPGAGTVVGGIGLLNERMILMFRSLSPSFWIVAVVFAIYSLVYRHNFGAPIIHFLLLGLLAYFLPISGMFRLLIWPAIFATVAASKVLAEISSGPWKGLHLRRPTLLRISTIFLVTLALLSATYPLLIPGNYTPSDYINAGSMGTVQSSYSISEYSAAVFVSSHPPSRNYIILSDPGFSLVLGGLTGGDAVRLTQPSNMLPFQRLLQVAEIAPINNTIANELQGLLSQYYATSNYGGVVIALSARTYYWIHNNGVITWEPMNSSFVDGNIRSNFLDSAPLTHVYSSLDVDLFYFPFQTNANVS